jgi:hypothetical protein
MSISTYIVDNTTDQVKQITPKFVKKFLQSGEPLKHLRFYMIASRYFSGRSGIFSADEFLDKIALNRKSTNHNPGNQRARLRKQLLSMLDNSVLFRKLPDGRFALKSNRKIYVKSQITNL